MKWFSHLAIGWAIGAPFGAGPAVLLGATAPDWLEHLGPFRHREETHQLIWWVILLCAGGILCLGLPEVGWHVFWFAAGGLSHWVADALTVSGVPLAPWTRFRVTLLGGRLRTGEPAEYLLAGGVFLLSLFLFGGGALRGSGRWSCYLVRAGWCEAAEKEVPFGEETLPLAAPAELRKHRFEW